MKSVKMNCHRCYLQLQYEFNQDSQSIIVDANMCQSIILNFFCFQLCFFNVKLSCFVAVFLGYYIEEI